MSITRHRHGLQVTGTPLFLDARRKAPVSFVSHAHSDHVARHAQTIATAPTLRLMEQRWGRIEAPLSVPYHQPFALGTLTLELLPAGHILGSAQLKVTRADGHVLLYTGDLNDQRTLTAEPLVSARCDTLVIESTYGDPQDRFPPRTEVLAQLFEWVERVLAAGDAPVLLCRPLGKAQELMAQLGRRGFRVVAHPSMWALAEVYRESGITFPAARAFDGRLQPDEVLLWPLHQVHAPEFLTFKRRPRKAVLSGGAGAGTRRSRDVRHFLLSDHADHAGLIAYAMATGAQEVLTHHGAAEALAAGMRGAGLNARALSDAVQLDLL
ncbi:MAG TPA: MBL fold metallo-hydrolase [Myxococcaceae bacterium]|nr:MBL fold metallo-hydrolase [Myxococcaceae bacterium]